MLTTLITLYALNADISYPTEGNEVGSGQEKEYFMNTSEHTTYPPLDEEINIIISKKSKGKKSGGKKSKKGKHFNSLESSELFGSLQTSTTNIVLATVGGVMVVTGMILVVKNYCKKRSGYTLVDNPEQRPIYGTMGNVYQGH